MSGSVKRELTRFVADLKREYDRITWEEVAERARAKFSDVQGLSLTKNAIRKRYNALHRSKESDNKRPGPKAMTQQDKEELRQELFGFIEDYIEKDMRPVIERVSAEAAEKALAEEFSNLQKMLAPRKEGYPPAPPMPGTVEGTRRHTVPRGKLAGTADSALLELFESERKDRGFSVSRMLDVVLYAYFSVGRPEPPRLSFELCEPSRFPEEE